MLEVVIECVREADRLLGIVICQLKSVECFITTAT